jgi:hypothetical protein
VTRIAYIVAYLAGAAAAVVLLDANIGDGEWAVAIWAIASVILGLGTGRPGFALLAFLAIPFAVPFGYPDNYQFSEPNPIWWSAAVLAFFSAGLIFFVALLRRIAELRRRRPAPPPGR